MTRAEIDALAAKLYHAGCGGRWSDEAGKDCLAFYRRLARAALEYLRR